MDGSLRKIIQLEKFGDVDQSLLEKILGIITDSYERLGPPMTYSVRLRVFETSEEDAFFASHDASDGKPTISVYMDKISGLPSNVVVGGIKRQIVHSILHGSPEFYKIKIPDELRRAMVEYSLPQDFAAKVIYGTSMAAKEYNVTKFLLGVENIEDQIAYTKYVLEPTVDEVLAWEALKANPMGRIAYLVMTIRDVSCAIPLTEDLRFRDEIKACIERKIDHIPPDRKSKIKKVINEVFPLFDNDTFRNIDLLTNAVVKEIIDGELAFHKETPQPI